MSVMPDLRVVRGGEALAPPPLPELLEQCWDVRELDGGLVEATVPLSIIEHNDVPVDQAHVEELAASIKAEAAQRRSDGQLARTSLAQVDDFDRLFITDGFHRDGAVRFLGRDTIKSTIRVGSTLEEVTDLRILAATGHNEVMFARVVEWVDEAWRRSPWSARLSAEQAFSLCLPNMTGERLGVSPEEAREIRDWATQKGEQWHLAPMTVYNHLSTAEKADPVLARAVRQQLGTPASMSVTQGHLSAIADTFPKDYGAQRLAVSVITGHKMSVARTKVALDKMARARNFDDMVALVNRTSWADVKAPPSRSHSGSGTKRTANSGTSTRTTDIDSGSETVPPPRPPADTASTPSTGLDNEVIRRLAHDSVLDGLQLSRLALDRLVLSGNYVAPVVRPSSIRALKVTYGDDPEVAALARAVDTRALMDRFTESARKVTPNALAMLDEQYDITGSEARDILHVVRGRILADMSDGDLRFLGAGGSTTHHQLLLNGVKEELQRYRANSEDRQPAPQVIHTASVTIGQVIDAVPRLKPVERKAVLMYGVLGLSALTTSRLIKGDVRPMEVPMLAQNASLIIKGSDR